MAGDRLDWTTRYGSTTRVLAASKIGCKEWVVARPDSGAHVAGLAGDGGVLAYAVGGAVGLVSEAKQRAPRWNRHAGADALAALEAAFSRGPTRYSVICTKTTTGARVVFQSYETKAEADAVAAQLRSIGCPADVELRP